MTTIIEDDVLFRDKNGWHQKYCVLKKISRIADGLHLYLFKDKKQCMEAETCPHMKEPTTPPASHTMGHHFGTVHSHSSPFSGAPPLSGAVDCNLAHGRVGYVDLVYGCFYGLHLHQKQWTILFICEGGIHCISMETIDDLTRWRTRLQPELRDQQFYVHLVQTNPTSKLPRNTAGWLIVQPSRICFFSEPRKKKGLRRIFSRSRPQSTDYSHMINQRPSSVLSAPGMENYVNTAVPRPMSTAAPFTASTLQTQVSANGASNSEDPRLLMTWPLSDLVYMKKFSTDLKVTTYLTYSSDPGSEEFSAAPDSGTGDLLHHLARNRVVRRMAGGHLKQLNFFCLVGARRHYSKGVGLHIFYAPEAQKLLDEVQRLTRVYFPSLPAMLKSNYKPMLLMSQTSVGSREMPPHHTLLSQRYTHPPATMEDDEEDEEEDTITSYAYSSPPTGSSPLDSGQSSPPLYHSQDSDDSKKDDGEVYENPSVHSELRSREGENEVLQQTTTTNVYDAPRTPREMSRATSWHVEPLVDNSNSETHKMLDEKFAFGSLEEIQKSLYNATETMKHGEESHHSKQDAVSSSEEDTIIVSQAVSPVYLRTDSSGKHSSNSTTHKKVSSSSSTSSPLPPPHVTTTSSVDTMRLCCGKFHKKTSKCRDEYENESGALINICCDGDGTPSDTEVSASVDSQIMSTSCDTSETELERLSGTQQPPQERQETYARMSADHSKDVLLHCNRHHHQQGSEGPYDEVELWVSEASVQQAKHNPYSTLRSYPHRHHHHHHHHLVQLQSPKDSPPFQPPQPKTASASTAGASVVTPRRRSLGALFRSTSRKYTSTSNISGEHVDTAQHPQTTKGKRSWFFGSLGRRRSPPQTAAANGGSTTIRSTPQTPDVARRVCSQVHPISPALQLFEQRNMTSAGGTSPIQNRSLPPAPKEVDAAPVQQVKVPLSTKTSLRVPTTTLGSTGNEYVDIDTSVKTTSTSVERPQLSTVLTAPVHEPGVEEDSYLVRSECPNAIYITPPVSPMMKNAPVDLPFNNLEGGLQQSSTRDEEVYVQGYRTLSPNHVGTRESRDGEEKSHVRTSLDESGVLRDKGHQPHSSTAPIVRNSRIRVYSESSAQSARQQELDKTSVMAVLSHQMNNKEGAESHNSNALGVSPNTGPPRFSRSISATHHSALPPNVLGSNSVHSKFPASECGSPAGGQHVNQHYTMGRQRYQSVSYMNHKPRSGADYAGYVLTSSTKGPSSSNDNYDMSITASSSSSVSNCNASHGKGDPLLQKMSEVSKSLNDPFDCKNHMYVNVTPSVTSVAVPTTTTTTTNNRPTAVLPLSHDYANVAVLNKTSSSHVDYVDLSADHADHRNNMNTRDAQKLSYVKLLDNKRTGESSSPVETTGIMLGGFHMRSAEVDSTDRGVHSGNQSLESSTVAGGKLSSSKRFMPVPVTSTVAPAVETNTSSMFQPATAASSASSSMLHQSLSSSSIGTLNQPQLLSKTSPLYWEVTAALRASVPRSEDAMSSCSSSNGRGDPAYVKLDFTKMNIISELMSDSSGTETPANGATAASSSSSHNTAVTPPLPPSAGAHDGPLAKLDVSGKKRSTLQPEDSTSLSFSTSPSISRRSSLMAFLTGNKKKSFNK